MTTPNKIFVPVVDKDNKPLMPTTPSRAARWVKAGKATPFWKHGIWCVRLNENPSGTELQPIAIGIDPGTKMEGYTIKSESHTYLNIQSSTTYWVSNGMKLRKMLRMKRRARKCPRRKPKHFNLKNRKCIPASIKARWDLKIRIVNWLRKVFPIACAVIEDVSAVTKRSGSKWNLSFNPVQHGKNWFYENFPIPFIKMEGIQTKELRDAYGLKKTSKKTSELFEAHCVDSWVLANSFTGGHVKPDNKKLFFLQPLRKHYRKLHYQNPSKGGIRKRYGTTRSLGFERGSIVKHKKFGECLVGGWSGNGITLHDRGTNERVSRAAKPGDILFKSFNSFLLREASPSLIA